MSFPLLWTSNPDIDQPQSVYGMKILGTFPHNARQGLPVFQGLLLIMDGNTGLPLALMDASYITCMRTGAAGALGVKLFSADAPQKLLVIGAGKQSIYQLQHPFYAARP